MTPEDKQHDIRMQWALLILSIATIIAVAVALHRELPGSEWQAHRREYREILAAKADSDIGRQILERFDIRIEQQVLPGLDTVDRCTTCHAGINDPRMVSEKQPFRTHPGKLLNYHPPESFGCTVCHRGQGRALTFADAKGEEGSYWEYPMLPAEYTQAECGRCHKQLPYADQSLKREGMRLFRKHCVDCHQVDGVGNVRGGDLSYRGLALLQRDWYDGHPAYRANPATNRLASAAVPADDRKLLQNFLQTRHGAPRLAHGRALYDEFGCGGCHKLGPEGGVLGPDLTRTGRKTIHEFSFSHVEGERSSVNWLLEHFLNPRRVTPGSEMPRLALQKEDSLALTTAVLSHRDEKLVLGKYVPADSKAIPVVVRGGQLFNRYCSGCHGKQGEGRAHLSFGYSVPGILNTGYFRVATPALIRSVGYAGRPDRKMPTWSENLNPATMENILDYIEAQRPRPVAHGRVRMIEAEKDRGKEVFARHCAYCHGAQGGGDIGVKLKDAALLGHADSLFLHKTVTEGRPGTPMPSWAELSAAELAALLALFADWKKDIGAKEVLTLPASKPHLGQALYANNCASCHGVAGQGSLGPALHNPVLLRNASSELLGASVDRCRRWAKTNVTQGPRELSTEDLAAVVAFIRSWKDAPMPVAPAEYGPLHGGNAAAGKPIFASKCSGCHGEQGVGGVSPAIGSPAFLRQVGDGFFTATLVTGRPDTIMEPLGTNAPNDSEPMNSRQLRDVVAYWRSLDPRKKISTDNQQQ